MESGPEWFGNIVLKFMHPPIWVLGALVVFGVAIIFICSYTLTLELKSNNSDNGISSVAGIFAGIMLTTVSLVLINLPTLMLLAKP